MTYFTMGDPNNDLLEIEYFKQEGGDEIKGIPTSDSKSSLPFLVRATSILTWGTNSVKSESHQCYNDEETNIFRPLVKKYSLSGKTILPPNYNTTDDDISECSYFTVTDYEDWTDESCISFDGDTDNNCEIQKEHVINRNLRIGNDYEDPPTTEVKELDVLHSSHESNIIDACMKIIKKSKGVKKHQPVHHLQLSECLWTFLGSFSTLYIVCLLSENVPPWNEGENTYAFPLGPFGALSTLQYGLTDAAPAQPRAVIYGSALSGFVAMSATYIPETIFPISFRIAFATGASIALMARLGVVHPPGGAIALVFAIGNYHWGHLLLTLLGCVIAVLISTIINNLNEARQYPLYWNFSAPFLQ